MKVDLFLDTSIKEQNFDADIQLSEEEYVDMLKKYSKTIDYSLDRFEKHEDPRYDVKDVQDENEEDIEVSEDDSLYVSSKATLYDINGYKLCEDEIEFMADEGEMVAMIIKIDEITNDLFESELKFWVKDSMNINNDTEITENERIRFLPKKVIKVMLPNKKTYAFIDCIMYNENKDMQYAIIIKKIIKLK